VSPVGSRAQAARRSSRRSVETPAHRAAELGEIAEIQRSRLLAGAVSAIEELGYARTTVAHITSTARVSRRTFYELFDNREACMSALLEDVLAAIGGDLAAAGLDGLPWRERVRGGLWVILSFFDREPALARICVVQVLGGGPKVLKRRERVLAQLTELIDEGREEGTRGRECAALTAEGLVGAALGIVHARLLGARHKPLTDLVGELASLIVLPYLGPAAARREQAREVATPDVAPARIQSDRDPLQGVPMRLTYRTARVLTCIAAQPGISNRAVAEYAGISDQGQISKLLARLERLALTTNSGSGHAKGEPNAWKLTPLGQQIAQSIQIHTPNQRRAA
jgi:AcrR family transcriptional regulator